LIENGKVKIAQTWEELTATYEYDTWIMINFEAIKESEPTELDPRQRGEVLWSTKHSLEKLEAERSLDPLTFECMNQGNPSSKHGLLYREFKTYKELPEQPLFIKSLTDTADEGDCFLCCVIYFEYLEFKYVLDVVYTQENNETVEPELAQKFTDMNVNEAVFESNNGGKGFARNVERICREKGNYITAFDPYHQSLNKEARILTNSTTVTNQIIMPANWMHRWSKFYKDVTKFKASYTANKYKDAPDVLTAIVERTPKSVPIIYR
jgi:predicted phage terminase large subunit-like protein